MKSEPRIAFVTDALPAVGGAEKTLFTALECFPHADVFTLVYNEPAFLRTPLGTRRVRTSLLDKLPPARRNHRLFLPLMPWAIEQFDFGQYDTVVSFSYAVANAAKAGSAKHLSYTHTPMRYAWNDLNIHGRSRGNNTLINRYFEWFRRWDRAAASRLLAFAAISNDIAARIQSIYQREAQVIYPPVEVDRFRASDERERYYAVVSRLVAHKRVDLIVKAFSALGLPLKIIGDGPERQQLMKQAAGNIEFLGFQSDECVASLLDRARGFICATEEDFGIAMVEAQAAGCPVIAYGRGGALETVVNGQTGLLFQQQSSDCLAETVSAFEQKASSFSARAISAHAQQFDKSVFKTEFRRFVEEA